MENRPHITCRELIDFLSLYLAGELPSDRVHEFERHLAACPSCVEYVASYKAMISLGKTAFEALEEPVDGSVPEDLVTAILAARKN